MDKLSQWMPPRVFGPVHQAMSTMVTATDCRFSATAPWTSRPEAVGRQQQNVATFQRVLRENLDPAAGCRRGSYRPLLRQGGTATCASVMTPFNQQANAGMVTGLADHAAVAHQVQARIADIAPSRRCPARCKRRR